MDQPTSIPSNMREIYDTIIASTDSICKEHLDEEYADLARKMATMLARKRPSPLSKGKLDIWACSIVYALGQVNFLFDKQQTPHMSSAELCALFDVKPATAQNKARIILEMLESGPCDPEFFRPSRAGDNPFTWLFETTDGFIVDIRDAPLDIQKVAFEQDLIPYIPSEHNKVKEPVEKDENKKESKSENIDKLYTLRATLIQGMVSRKFHENNPVVSRTIEIKGSQTLKALHYAIFDSVEFDDEHFYAFEVGGKKPYSQSATRYALQPSGGGPGGWASGLFGDSPKEKDVTQAKISSLDLKPKQKFFYEFDYGDEWWWEIQVVSVNDKVPKRKYPRVTERVGENPPQYLSEEEELDEEFMDEE